VATNTSETTEENLDASFSMQSMLYQKKVCVSVCVPSSVLAWQWLGKHIPVVMNTHTVIEELLHESFSTLSVSYQRKVGDKFFPELLVT
jgi:hypothetical protein